jgi:hypothetical protein
MTCERIADPYDDWAWACEVAALKADRVMNTVSDPATVRCRAAVERRVCNESMVVSASKDAL